ncbi:MAG: GGDEF domain-containing protein [Spirochaetales bacterium]|nr:GGDEF domain-containing protein [Spirochaetales bacterium]
MLAILLFPACLPAGGRSDSILTVEKGEIDLSSFSCFNTSSPIRLDGQWDFRWNELLEPGDPEWLETPEKYYPVPLFWTSYKGQDYERVGQGTYRLLIRTSQECQYYGIKLPEIFSEYRLWINSDLVDERWAGEGEKVLFLKPWTFVVHSESEVLDVILQVRNLNHSNAGIGQSILIGSEQEIRRNNLFYISLDVILIGICLFAGIYHSIIYIFRREEKELLYFGLFCFTISLRTFTTGSTLISQVFPSIPFLIGSRIATLFIPLSVFFFLAFSYYFFREYVPVVLFKILQAINLSYLILVLVTDSLVYSKIYSWYLLVIIASCALVIGINVYAIIKKKAYSLIFFSGWLILMAGIANDMMHYLQIIITGYFLSAFFAGFILLESLILAIKFSQEHRMVYELSERLEKAINTANQDPLTGLFNRRYLEMVGNREQGLYRRYGTCFSLVILDIDRFKGINDSFGHDVGDIVIMKLADVISRQVRDTDIPARYGGDEFVVLLPQSRGQDALHVAEKIRKAVEETVVSVEDDQDIRFTISLGVASSCSKEDSYESILRRADERLYESKDKGRNKVSFCVD